MSVDRRRFLQIAAGASAIAAAPCVLAEAARRRLLILVELKGGNDGLNTVIPYSDPQYARLRPRLAVAREQAIALDERVALHPSLEQLLPSWKDGKLAIVEGVGYPEPNLSHFRSIEIWDTASKSDEYLEEGWLARAFARSPSPPEFVSDGIVVGSADLGPLSGARARALALTDPERFLRNARLARPGGEARNAALRHILKVENDVQQSARRISGGREFRVEFAPGAFGNVLKTAAQLAANPAGVAAIRISLGGFDTHANQANLHANQLRQLAEGLAALRAALEETGRWDSTVIATYSEFGRRPRENQSAGTDHGTAGVHFVLGGAVKGGLYGAAPALDRLDANGNLPFAVDFRAYYATFLERWWSIDARAVLGARHETLAFLA
jgi:uncharacterized protein (DUF1501 family)